MVAGITVLTAALSAAAQPAVPPSDNAPIALVETFADGATTFELVTPKPAWRWTPQFPRVDHFIPRAGEPPVAALKISRVLVGGDIKVGVSLLVGTLRDEVPVAEILVTPGSSIVVDELRNYGVLPITLSAATIAPLMPYPPIVVSRSPELEVSSVEIHSAPYPGYRITLRNLSSMAVSNVHFQSYRGEEKALGGLPRGQNGLPLLTAGGTYELDINLTGGAANPLTASTTWSPRPLDVIEIDSIRWENSTHTGNPLYPAVEAVIEGDGGRRVQLTRVIDAFRNVLNRSGSGPDLVADLKGQIAALRDSEPDQLENAQAAMRSVKFAVLSDIIRFEATARSREIGYVREWLALTLKRCEGWLSRLAA